MGAVEVIKQLWLSEKSFMLAERENKLVFLVDRSANKPTIKRAVEEKYGVKVDRVWTMNTKHGKKAIVKLAEGYSAEEILIRLGVI
ncbi:MAG: 50S ribosomal protein L23 [Thermoplasmata archaeon]|nr:MAG: 50S ribosomal protein L23 [Thermoplasmata archaeon]HDJ26797.1 50S ribosomal protein L23 [Aciduliprofundum sp.]